MRRSAFFFGGARRLRRPHARTFSDIRTPSGKSALRRPFSFLTNAVPLPAAPGVPASLRRLRALVPRLMRTAPCCAHCAVSAVPFCGPAFRPQSLLFQELSVRALRVLVFFKDAPRGSQGRFCPWSRERKGQAKGVLRFCERRIRCTHFRRLDRRLLEYRLTAAVVPVFVDLFFWVSIAPCFFAS